MSMVDTAPQFQDTKIFGLIDDARHGNIWLWRTVVAMLTGSALLFAIQFFDPRLFNGVSVWDKPAKFFLSLAVQYGTVSWALSQMPRVGEKLKGINWAVWLMLIAGWGEMAYMIFRASRAEASHFNSTSLSGIIGYAMMGVGSLTLTFTAAFIGWKIWRKRSSGIWTEAAGLALMVGALLGTIAGGYMSAQTSHWMGGVQSDANALAFFNWSTTGGDLRVAHFMGLHAAQFIPLAALSGDRRVVYISTLVLAIMTGLLFAMGMIGIPLFRA